MTLSGKILASFGSIFAVTAALSWSSLAGIGGLRGMAREGMLRSGRAVELVGELSTTVANMRFNQRGMVMYQSQKNEKEANSCVRRFRDDVTKMRGLVAELRPLLSSAAEQEHVQAFDNAQ